MGHCVWRIVCHKSKAYLRNLSVLSNNFLKKVRVYLLVYGGLRNEKNSEYTVWSVCRYVGKEAAKEMHEEDICLEEYIDKMKLYK